MSYEIHYRTCHLCEACCGLEMHVEAGKVIAVKGDDKDPLSRGHICPKATAISDVQEDPDRLRTPMRRVGSEWQPVSWDEAFEDIAERFAALQTKYGRDAIASYLGNPNVHNYGNSLHLPNLLRHLNKRNRFSASTVDQMPHHLVNFWMFGHMSMFPIPDVDRTQFMLIIGGNPLASNGSLWTVPDVKARLKAMIARGGKLIVLDPRRTETAQIASKHYFIKPGQDAAFLMGLLISLKEKKRIAPGRLEAMAVGWDALWSSLEGIKIENLAQACGVDASIIERLAQELADAPTAVCHGRIGVSTQAYGTLCQWLIQLINIVTGNMDRPGGVMFASPAADLLSSGGVGGWGRWHSRVSERPEVCGEIPAACLAEEILTPGEGQVRALFTCAGNPVLSTPNGRQLEQALAKLDFMVSIDIALNETTRHAHYILPPTGPLEKSHYDLSFYLLAVRNVARFSSPIRQKAANSFHDWEIMAELGARLAQKLGAEYKSLPAPEVQLDSLLKAGTYGLSLQTLKDSVHGLDLGPLMPCLPERLFTSDKKIQLAPEYLLADIKRFLADMNATPQASLLLIGRRHIRSNNSWMHNYQRLVKGADRCTLLMHPEDARQRNLNSGSRAKLASRVGEVEVMVEITADMMPGVVSLPHGWGHNRPGTRLTIAQAHAGTSINDVTDEKRIDPLSGNAAVTAVPVEVVAA